MASPIEQVDGVTTDTQWLRHMWGVPLDDVLSWPLSHDTSGFSRANWSNLECNEIVLTFPFSENLR